jgi:hypothetical protein
MATIGSGAAYFDDVSFATISPATRITLEPDVHIRGAELYIRDNKAHAGDEAGFGYVANTTTETNVYSRIIRGGSMGTTGGFKYDLRAFVYNGTASTRTVTFRYYFGSSLLYTYGPNNVAAGAVIPFVHQGRLSNIFSASAQQCSGLLIRDTAINTLFNSGTAEDTTADKEFKITVTFNFANPALSHNLLGGEMAGPYSH